MSAEIEGSVKDRPVHRYTALRPLGTLGSRLMQLIAARLALVISADQPFSRAPFSQPLRLIVGEPATEFYGGITRGLRAGSGRVSATTRGR